MVRIVIVVIIAALFGSIGFAMYYYIQFQPNFVIANAGEPLQVGPVKYIIEYEGQHNGDKETQPEHTFVKIRIIAENLNEDTTRMYGGQFFILDEDDKKYQAVYGQFSDEDLYQDHLELNKPVSWTTQFDIPFDETEQYRIGILPSKEQSSIDIGMVCITNCYNLDLRS